MDCILEPRQLGGCDEPAGFVPMDLDLATRIGKVVFLNWIPYRKIHGEIAAWLARNQIPHFLPEPLPGALYADASHPLTAGFELLAKRL